jgi:hypothetical protein
MEGIAICLAAMLGCFIAGRRSIVWGVGAVMTIGYAYGILRANVPNPAMHFLFDSGALGFYLALISRGLKPEQRKCLGALQPWMVLLVGWPLLLFLFPVQDPLVQLVGLRGQIFFIPFILIGAMLEADDWYALAKWFAVLNLVAFGFALAEYVEGVPKFFPNNAMTTIIYASRDVAGHTAFRIPSTFISAAPYSSMMVATITLLLGAQVQRRGRKLDFWLLSAAIVATGIGVFMGASRSQAVALFMMLGLTFLMGHLSFKVIFRVAIVVVCVGWIVANNERLQRFTTLSDTDVLEERFNYSVNQSFFETALKYPMGNGLGGGGTSVPYFLRDRLKNQVALENEYGRIMLEEGVPGLLIWIAFIVWVMLSPLPKKNNPWRLSLRLSRMYLFISFTTAVMGSGMLNAVPGTAFLLMLVGWVSLRRLAPAAQRSAQPSFGHQARRQSELRVTL